MMTIGPHVRKQPLVWKKVNNVATELEPRKGTDTMTPDRNTSTASTVTSAETSTTTSTVSSVANPEPKRHSANPAGPRAGQASTSGSAPASKKVAKANGEGSTPTPGGQSIWAQKAAARAAASAAKVKADGDADSRADHRGGPVPVKGLSSNRHHAQNEGLLSQSRKRFYQNVQHRHHHHQHHYDHHEDDSQERTHGAHNHDWRDDRDRRRMNRNYIQGAQIEGGQVDHEEEPNANLDVNLNLQPKLRQKSHNKHKYQPQQKYRQQRQAFHHHHHHHHHHHYHNRRPFAAARGSSVRDSPRPASRYSSLIQPRTGLVPERIIRTQYYRDDQQISDEYIIDDAVYEDDGMYEDEYYFDEDDDLDHADYDSEYLEEGGYDDVAYDDVLYEDGQDYQERGFIDQAYDDAPPQDAFYHEDGIQEQVYPEQIYQEPIYPSTIFPDAPYQEVVYQELTYPELAFGVPNYQEPTYADASYPDGSYQQPIYADDLYTQEQYQDPAYQDPAYQDPAYQDPAYQDPAYQDPAYQDPAYQDPAYQDPAYQDPACQDPLYEEQIYQDPGYQPAVYPDPNYINEMYPEEHLNANIYIGDEHPVIHPRHQLTYLPGSIDGYRNPESNVHDEFLHPDIFPFPDMYPIPEEPLDEDIQYSYPMRKSHSFNTRPTRHRHRPRRARSRDASVQHRSSSTSTNSVTASSPSPVPSPPLRIGVSVEDDDLHPFCLVCLEQVGVTDPIWSCDQCYEIFHLSCIQPWSINRSSQNPSVNRQKSSHALPTWECPKCRKPHTLETGPLKYTCYCKKVEKPTPDPWLAPHSCGRVCDKKHTPDCNHRCEQLCHRGACPPCPQSVIKNCFCGREFKTLQCASPPFSCGQTCDRLLPCGVHKCSLACHEGPCPPCGHKMMRVCLCGKVEAIGSCSKEAFRCDKKCGKRLPCGNHFCQEICHKGPSCPPCSLTGPRVCPCGKKSGLRLPCKLETPSCGDMCNKVLSCSKHRCQDKCHKGNCSPCKHLTIKSCACRSTRAEVRCGEILKCDVKCNRMRSCQRHVCRQKCCDGKCAPCPEICNRKLGCGLHNCTMPCHSGPCFPCTASFQLSCQCGETVRVFPCGKQSVAQPPHCSRNCQKQNQCHHAEKEPHRCHFGDCPPCQLTCEKKLNGCEHICNFPCHGAVTPLLVDKDGSEPVDKAASKIPLAPPTPCPLCPVKVTRLCMGEHKMHEVTCSTPAFSCQEPCGRKLSCGNHSCQKACHALPPSPSPDQLARGDSLPYNIQNRTSNCGDCTLPCKVKRKCSHSCPRSCHTGPCPPCHEIRRRKCHCGNRNLQLKCEQYTDAVNVSGVEITDPKSNPTLAKLLSCNHICNKKLPNCQHSCTDVCHPGSCFEGKRCMKKVLVKCPCRRLKAEFMCFAIEEAKERGELVLACNEVCLQPRSTTQQQAAPSLVQEMIAEEEEPVEKQTASLQTEEANTSAPPKDRKLKKLKLATPKSNQDIKNRTASAFHQRLLMIACLIAALIIPILVLQLGL